MDSMPVPATTVLPGEWPGIEARWTGNGKYLNILVTDGASREGLFAALKAYATGLKFHRVTDAGELLFERLSTFERSSALAWPSVVDALDAT